MLDKPKVERHSYAVLDGLRGLAAIAVAILHMPRVFDGFKMPNAHLAVDFFLQLSGFVLAYAYGNRIVSGVRFGAFLKLRINRLYPTYVLGVILGLLVAVAALKFPGSALSVDWTPRDFAISAVLNSLMLPAVGLKQGFLFPLNPPMWTVFTELLVNILFLFTWRFLKISKTSLPVTVVLLAALLPIALDRGTLDFGYGWSTFLIGLLRLTTSFCIGLSVFNLQGAVKRKSNFISVLVFAVLGAILAWQTNNIGFELVVSFLLFPGIVFAGAMFNPENRTFVWLCEQLGKTSYVIYVIHKPLYQLVYGAITKFAPSLVDQLGASLGVGMLLAFMLLSCWLANVYEVKARKWLKSVGC